MFFEKLELFLMQVKDVFLNINWITDILDILLVAVILYAIIKQLRKSQSIQVIKGIVFVALVYGIVKIVGMQTSSFLFSKLFSDIIIIFVVLFSTELRHALENLGKKKFGKNMFFNSSSSDESEIEAINAVCRACGAMSRSKVGSLIVFQRKSLLGDLTKHAVGIDSETTFEMICSIFYPKAPLHDGAVVIKDGRIVAARCVVPMKNDRIVEEEVGTRHRAAMEVSLNSDAVAVITSEETGIISLAVDGKLIRGLSDSELREKLGALLLSNKNQKGRRFSRKDKAEEINVVSTEVSESDENVAEAEDVVNAEMEAPFEATVSADENKIENEGDVNDEQE